MPTVLASNVEAKAATATETCGYDFTPKLDIKNSETLTGTPTIAFSPSGPTSAGAAIISNATVIHGVEVAASRGVTWRTAGGTAGTKYTVTVTVSTSTSQILVYKGDLEVVD